MRRTCARPKVAIQNELLDELRRLQQRKALARGLGEVLVQVAQKAGVPVRVREVVHQRAGVRVLPLPEAEQRGGAVGARLQGPERVVGEVEEPGGGRMGAHGVEHMEQVVAVRQGAPLRGAKVELALVLRALPALAGARQERARNERVVFQKAHEDAAEQPGDGGLGDDLLAPGLEGALAQRRVGVALVRRGGALAQVVFQAAQQALQVREQGGCVDHGDFLSLIAAP